MVPLSETEKIVAEQYCHGLMDGEIAEALKKPVWTIRTHKKRIYKKLGIATTHELVLYMVGRKGSPAHGSCCYPHGHHAIPDSCC